jgi:predicted ATPase/class 3 adenylate cyclase
VTFLFTDILGSTRLWQDHPRAMGEALARHDACLRDAIESNHGLVFKTVGDAFYAVFAKAIDGLQAALSAQLALKRETWPEKIPISVRMALHTGEAEERDRDYFGSALNRAARLLSLGHGAQILLSLVTTELVRDMLPERVSLKLLGEQRLKDLTRPESVYQAVHHELPSDFPALHSLDTHPHNLPIQPGPLIGRERELAEAERLCLQDSRMLTLTGPGGMGKTRLALQVGADLLERFEDGVFFVDLAAATDPALVPSLIAQALRVQEAGSQSILQALKEHICQKHLLLLLDNFEQVLEAALQVVALLASCPNVRFLVTSREALRVRDERIYHVPPLSLPEKGNRAGQTVKALTQYEAVRLFVERAVAANPAFQVTNENAPAVAEVCLQLEGIPLAIELAAARAKLLTPEGILSRLAKPLELLKGGPRDAPDRQKTLRATIDWSYNLLGKQSKVTFETLSVFSGGFTQAAAEALTADQIGAGLDVLEELEELVDKSLLMLKEKAGTEPRFSMLETIREYGLERLAACQALEPTRQAHALYFLHLVEDTELRCLGPKPHFCLNELETEHDNLREAIRWGSQAGKTEIVLRLTANLARFWQLRGHLSEGRDKLASALALGAEAPAALRVPVLLGAGLLAREQGDYQQSLQYLGIARSLSQETRDSAGLAKVNHELGWTLYRKDEIEPSADAFTAGRRGAEETQNRQLAAMCDLGQGLIEWRRGDLENAQTLFKRSYLEFDRMGSLRLEAQALCNLGLIELKRGNLQEAGQKYSRAALILREIGDLSTLRTILNNLGDLSRRQGDFRKAILYYDQLAQLAQELRDPRALSTAYSGLAENLLSLQELDQALPWAKEACRIAEGLGGSIELGVSLRVMAEILEAAQDYEAAAGKLEQAILMLKQAKDAEELDAAQKAFKRLRAEIQKKAGGAV